MTDGPALIVEKASLLKPNLETALKNHIKSKAQYIKLYLPVRIIILENGGIWMMNMLESEPEPVQIHINGYPNEQIHGQLFMTQQNIIIKLIIPRKETIAKSYEILYYIN